MEGEKEQYKPAIQPGPSSGAPAVYSQPTPMEHDQTTERKCCVPEEIDYDDRKRRLGRSSYVNAPAGRNKVRWDSQLKRSDLADSGQRLLQDPTNVEVEENPTVNNVGRIERWQRGLHLTRLVPPTTVERRELFEGPTIKGRCFQTVEGTLQGFSWHPERKVLTDGLSEFLRVQDRGPVLPLAVLWFTLEKNKYDSKQLEELGCNLCRVLDRIPVQILPNVPKNMDIRGIALTAALKPILTSKTTGKIWDLPTIRLQPKGKIEPGSDKLFNVQIPFYEPTGKLSHGTIKLDPTRVNPDATPPPVPEALQFPMSEIPIDFKSRYPTQCALGLQVLKHFTWQVMAPCLKVENCLLPILQQDNNVHHTDK